MAKEEYILDGYLFDSQEEFLRAKKEKETIVYLTANTDNSDMKALLRIYNRSVDRGSFRTVIGQQYLHNIRQRLIGSQVVSEDMLAPIPVVPSIRTGAEPDQQLTKQVERYKKAYESALVNRKIKNLSIGVLIAIIIGMIVITATSRNSVFTYRLQRKYSGRNGE